MSKKNDKAIPQSQGMKQKSISSFFAAKAKSNQHIPAVCKAGLKAASASNKEDSQHLTTPAQTTTAGISPAENAAAKPQRREENAAAAPSISARQASSTAKPTATSNVGDTSVQQKAPAHAAIHQQHANTVTPMPTKNIKVPAKLGKALDLGVGAGDAVVGRRIKVFCSKDKAWYGGHIQAYKDGKHIVQYEGGKEEWLNLAQQRHKLLPAGGPGAAAAVARRQKRKGVLISDSEDEDDSEGETAGGSDVDDSDFSAGGEDSDADEEMADLEAEGEDDNELAGCDAEDESAGRKRKRTASKGSRKRSTSAAMSTPCAAATDEQTVPSSAGHTPMDRFSCGSKPTPAQGFPGFTPLHTAGSAGTPNAKLGLFRTASKDSRGGSHTSRQTSITPSATPSMTPAPSGSIAAALDGLTPDSKAKEVLQGALDLTPSAERSTAEPAIVLGVLASGGAEAARFAARMAERFSFLHPKRIRDKSGHRPSDPDYNPRTLQIPAGWFKEAKVSEAQQQWWNFKSNNFDSVLLFKVGKFYEMFEMDAFVGVDVLGLSFMKGEQPHAGFPEAAYHIMAEQLARAGYRVVVVEQTETPEQLKARNAARKPGQKAANVVERQAVAVLSRGTLMDPEMVAGHPDAAYVLAVVEVTDGSGHDAPFIGACALDTAAGQILIGSWQDDEVRLKLRTQLTGLRPVEVVLPRRGSDAMSATTSRLVRCGGSRGPAPALNELPAMGADASTGLQALNKHFSHIEVPAVLQQLQAQYKAGQLASHEAAEARSARIAEAGLGAFGLMVQFLNNNMLDAALLPNARYEALCDGVTGSDEPVAMELNGAALEGLEILENALGGTHGSLLGLLDHCTTPFGRRRLRRWLTRPLYRVKDISRRQDAVEELMGTGSAAVSSARRALAGCSDLERCLARLGASAGRSGSSTTEGRGFGREAAHVVLYEDQAKRRVKVLVGAMKDLQALQDALEAFGKLSLKSDLLAALTDPVRWSDFQCKLDEMQSAAEWDTAENLGVVRPNKEGVDAAYDAAKAAVEEADEELKAYLSRVRKELDCRAINYVSLNKDSHVLEVPEAACNSIPSKLSLVSQRKGFKRYSSDELKELVANREDAEAEQEKVEAGVLLALERLFVSHHELWSSAIEAVAVLDCLMALAGAAMAADGDMCRPKLLEPNATSAGIFTAKQLRHPAGLGSTSCGSFVPNDISLGGDSPAFILLTGPNMGGKSTVLRQVCLAAVLAQVGAMVPAASLELTPMDGCFVRMGARDAILSGQSTFYIEMAESAAMLSRATSRSLVVLDELGRGTATLDGAAIAAAVLDHLAHTTQCCALFATHYHQLAAEHEHDAQVAIMHMACAVAEQPAADDPDDQADVAEVTFLYKLTAGACPKSYGTNVARLAGLPASVVSRAAVISASREATAMAGKKRAAAAAAAAGHATRDSSADMDVDHQQHQQQEANPAAATSDKEAADVQQLIGNVQKQLLQLKGGSGVSDAAGLIDQLTQLQQHAAELCS